MSDLDSAEVNLFSLYFSVSHDDPLCNGDAECGALTALNKQALTR